MLRRSAASRARMPLCCTGVSSSRRGASDQGRALAALLVLTGCSLSCAHEKPQRHDVEARPIASATGNTGASPAPLPSESTPEERYPTYPRTGAPGSTTSTISCGNMRCDASTHACDWNPAANQWACVSPNVPEEDQASELSEHPFLVRCDDASDCPSGQRCCRHTDNYSRFAARCTPTDDVDACVAEICYEGACPAGTSCVRGVEDADDMVDPGGHQGTCLPPKGAATCAGKVRCPVDRPICVLAKEGPTCAAEESETFLRAGPRDRLVCTLQSDCHGEEVCTYGFGETQTLGTYCARWSPGLSGDVACDPGGPRERKGTAAEESRFCNRKNCPACDSEGCRQSLACRPRTGLPWLGRLTGY